MPMDQRIINQQHCQRSNEPWGPGTEVVASYQFRGSSNEDLPFKKGDVITIVQATRDPNWYRGRNGSGQEGMVPATYVEKRHTSHFTPKEVAPHAERKEVTLHAMPWYHGQISREQAELLLQHMEDGVFLVRDSVHFRGDFTLSVSFAGKVDHYRIMAFNNKLEVDGGDCYFDTLFELVEHYRNDADGLCTRLLEPLQKKGSSFGEVDLQDFKSGGWVIDKKDLFVGETIGGGEFGDVCKGDYRGQQVAIKQLKKQDNAAQAFLQEASVMTSLRHHNLVQLIGVVLGDNIQIITEFMGKGNLVEYLRSRGRSVITKKDQINFATDTCSAMEYLESKNCVHRDLAARNVLISDDFTAKVSDFGLARHEDFRQDGGKFPIKWTAPEALGENKFTSKSDMWSFGILLWEIYSFGRVPYPRIPLAEVLQYVKKGYRMESPDGCPKEVYSIMMDAWNIEANSRPTFKEVLHRLNNLRATTV